MLKNYLLVALRTLRRQRGYATINVLGLATRVACCLFLLLYVRDELSYDRFHEDAEAIFRINLRPPGNEEIALTPTIAAPLLKREFPEVVATTRVESSGGLVRVGDRVFDEGDFYYADSTFFDVFSFHMLSGDPATALVRPNTVVLTESTARRYFGDRDPIGQTLVRNNDREFEITGVMADVPPNSHFRFDLLGSFTTREYWATTETWSSANFYTFARLADASQAPALQTKIDALLAKLRDDGEEPRYLVLQPLTDIHLSTGIGYEIDGSGQMAYVVGFSTLAILILLIACINYMNLATARSTMRSREVGLRKSLGALRRQLIGQFYGEAVLLTTGSLVLAFVLVAAGLPWFNSLSGKQLTVSTLVEPGIIALVLGVFVIVGLIAGSYPALFLSGVEPVRALRGRYSASKGTAHVRRALVVVQFSISAFLIVGTIVVMSQLRFMQERNLGFDKEHVVAIPMNDPAMYQSYDAIRQSMVQSPAISAVSAVNQIPGRLGWTSRFRGEGMSEGEEFLVKGMPVEAGVVEALGLEVIAGRALPESPTPPDSQNYVFVINETAAQRMGWTPVEAVGQRVGVPPRFGEVVGVVRDFNFNSLHVTVEPLAIWYQPQEIRSIVARMVPGQQQAALADMKQTIAQFAPGVPFTARFIDDVYDQLYTDEQQMGSVMTVFAALAILVACLGLLGLASFTAEKRTREIGVRKVLGASVPDIVALLSKDFIVLVGVAFGLAIPVTWLVLKGWLSGFAYTITLGPGVFIAACILILAIALFTVGTQAMRAALIDPVRSLRYE